MNLFMKPGTVLPIEMPLILFAPDSAWSKTFFYFSYENARLAYQISFFYCSLSFALIAGSNFFITSPKRSLAPSGGFYLSTTGFLFWPFPPFFLSSSTFGAS